MRIESIELYEVGRNYKVTATRVIRGTRISPSQDEWDASDLEFAEPYKLQNGEILDSEDDINFVSNTGRRFSRNKPD